LKISFDQKKVKLACNREIRSNKREFNDYVDMMRGGGGQKMSVFVHVQGMKTVHVRGGGKKWQNSVHVVVE